MPDDPPSVAVVTGASRGIGRATALALGHPTVGIARGGSTTPGIREMVSCDVRDRTQVDAVFADVAERHGALSVLVACAGVAHAGSTLDLDPDLITEQVETNLLGALWCLRAFARHAGGPHPVAVLISSTSASRPSPDWATYAAAKAGVESLAASLDADLRGQGIRVFCLAPGRCATQLRTQMVGVEEDPDTLMSPRDVAGVVARLVADVQFPDGGVAMRHLAGQTIRVAR